MSPPAVGLLTLPFWGAVVSLDERGLWLGGLANPVLAGAVAGLWVGEPWAGLWIGVLFQALWPVRIESGGNIPPGGGLAAVAATGTAATLGVPGAPPASAWLDRLGAGPHPNEPETLDGGFWLAIVALAIAIAWAARVWETSARARNRIREDRALHTVPSRAGIRLATGAALAESGFRGIALVGVPMVLGAWAQKGLEGRSPAVSSDLDAAALWLLPSFLALGVGGAAWGLRRSRASLVDWGLGAVLGGATAILLGTLR